MLASPVMKRSTNGFLLWSQLAVAVSGVAANPLVGWTKLSPIAATAIAQLSSAPTFSVAWKPWISMRNRGTTPPAAAPTTFDKYKKLKDRCDSRPGVLRMANIASGMVAPMQAHQGTNAVATQAPERA